MGTLFLCASVSPLDGAQQKSVTCRLAGLTWPETRCQGLVGKLSHGDTVNIVALPPVGLGKDSAPSRQRPHRKGDLPPHWPSLAAPGLDSEPRWGSPDTGTGAAPAWGQAPGWPFPCRIAGTSQACVIPLATHAFPQQDRGPGSPARNKPGPAEPWQGPNTSVLCTGVGDSPVSACRDLLPTWLCQGGPLHLRGCHVCGWWAQGQGQPPSPATHPFSVPLGLGLPPLLECRRLGSRGVTAQSSSMAPCSGQVIALSSQHDCSPQLQPARGGSSPLPQAATDSRRRRSRRSGRRSRRRGRQCPQPHYPAHMTWRCHLRCVETCPRSSWISQHFPAWNSSRTRGADGPTVPCHGAWGTWSSPFVL